MIRRINLYGGPGSGKSTKASELFAALKNKGYNVELCQEYVKRFAYSGKKITEFDQIYIFAKQMHAETMYLDNGVDIIVTDCPTHLSYIYSKDLYPDISNEIKLLNSRYDAQYPSFNVFIKRGEKPYRQNGRYQSYEEARKIDDQILENTRIDFSFPFYQSVDTIIYELERLRS